MAEEEYGKDMVYAGEPTERGQQTEEQAVEERKGKPISNWLLVVVAVVALVITVYYIGFGNIKFSFGKSLNDTNMSQQQNGTQNGTEMLPEPVSTGNVSSISYTGANTTLISREEFNFTVRVGCEGNCNSLYLSLYDGSNLLATYENSSAWNSTVDIVVPFITPHRMNATFALAVYADSRGSNHTGLGLDSEKTATVNFNVLDSLQMLTYGSEFYLDRGETGNLSDLNVTIRLDSIANGEVRISVIRKDGIAYGSMLNPSSKPNATFFDFLTIELLNMSSNQVKLVAWPDGSIEAIGLQSPLSNNISAFTTFEVSLKCSGTCAATYVGIYILYQSNLTRIGFYNQTSLWSSSQVISIPIAMPAFYQNTTSEIKILADAKNSVNVFYYDLWHPPEKMMNKNFTIE